MAEEEHQYEEIIEYEEPEEQRRQPGFLSYMRRCKLKSPLAVVFLATLVIGLALVVVLTIALTPRGSMNNRSAEPTTSEATSAEPTTPEATSAEPTTAKATSTEPSTPEATSAEPTTVKPGPLSKTHCIFAGDLLNFGKDKPAESEVQREGSFILGIAKTLFDRPLDSTAAIWVYGYTKDSKIFKVTNDTMFNNYEDFENKVKDKMTIVPSVRPGKNSRAVSLPRNFKDEGHNANCIVFLTAVNNANAFENATLKTAFSKEVAVSLKSVDVSSIVPKGEAVKVSKGYTKDDVDRVVKAILK